MAQRQTVGGNFFGIIAMMLPIVYCFGLVAYFAGVGQWLGGSFGMAMPQDLMATIAGLTIVGMLFCIGPIIKIIRFIARQSATPAPRDPNDGATMRDGDAASNGDFNADDAIARYLAKRGGVAEAGPPLAEPAAPPRPQFGRRGI